ncbi:SDR family NAD(P)-dependent oxidoreductase [Micromonospora chersina]|uniref:SDR family NAD(P)-dependent oxidoreductase n=1 Tax=Micromonospora chersina TaxID=47854 RepID=UPI003F57E1CB
MTQRVVITGASAGVGRAVARAYAARGARLALLARGAAGLAAAERDCRRLGAAEVRTYQVDVADAGAVVARDGYESQQTDTPIDPATWRDNLDRPSDDERDRGAEGVFTDRARRHSAALWVSAHKPAVSALTLGG